MGWNITTSNVNVRLPRDIFHNLPDPATARQVASQIYLPEHIEEWAQSLGKKSSGPVSRYLSITADRAAARA